jgi:hypothetical protein
MVHQATQTVLAAQSGPGCVGALAGFRLVRRIGSGGRAEVFLAKPAAEGPEGGPVALKVFRAGTEAASIDREVRALGAAPRAALPTLDDVATTPDGRVCLILSYLPGQDLDRLLAARGRISAAEVVTVAATITATAQVLHETGLCHPLVRASCVRFDHNGRPVLLGLGSLLDLPSGVAGVSVRRDAAVGLTGFVAGLLQYLDPADPAAAAAPALLARFTATTTARPFPATLAGLEAALFDWASAGPVRRANGSARDSPSNGAARAVQAPVPVSVAAAERVRDLPSTDARHRGRPGTSWLTRVGGGRRPTGYDHHARRDTRHRFGLCGAGGTGTAPAGGLVGLGPAERRRAAATPGGRVGSVALDRRCGGGLRDPAGLSQWVWPGVGH